MFLISFIKHKYGHQIRGVTCGSDARRVNHIWLCEVFQITLCINVKPRGIWPSITVSHSQILTDKILESVVAKGSGKLVAKGSGKLVAKGSGKLVSLDLSCVPKVLTKHAFSVIGVYCPILKHGDIWHAVCNFSLYRPVTYLGLRIRWDVYWTHFPNLAHIKGKKNGNKKTLVIKYWCYYWLQCAGIISRGPVMTGVKDLKLQAVFQS